MAEAQVLDVYYMKMLHHNVDARKGKLSPGQVVRMDKAQAERYLMTGMAEQTTEGAFTAQQDKKEVRSTAQQEAFHALNDGHAMWDVSTYRDVMTAPEGGLRIAYERGIPLVNIHMLRDKDGNPLAPDADIEDILDAKDLIHPDAQAPFAAHDRSSVMGGGSPYGNPMPLSPAHKEMMERVAAQELYAQKPPSDSYVADDEGARSRQKNGERANRASRRAGKVSDEGKKLAESGKPPEPASGSQVAN